MTGVQLLNEIEAALITTLEPRLNKQGARWTDAEEYIQTIDDETVEVTMAQVIDRHDDLTSQIEAFEKKVLKKLK